MVAVDELLPLQNLFHLGSYQQVINEITSTPPPTNEATKLERQLLLYRSYLSQKKYNLVISEIPDTASVDLRAVKLLATFLNGNRKDDSLIDNMRNLLKEVGGGPGLQIIAATFFFHLELYEDALKCVVQFPKSIEW